MVAKRGSIITVLIFTCTLFVCGTASRAYGHEKPKIEIGLGATGTVLLESFGEINRELRNLNYKQIDISSTNKFSYSAFVVYNKSIFQLSGTNYIGQDGVLDGFGVEVLYGYDLMKRGSNNRLSPFATIGFRQCALSIPIETLVARSIFSNFGLSYERIFRISPIQFSIGANAGVLIKYKPERWLTTSNRESLFGGFIGLIFRIVLFEK